MFLPEANSNLFHLQPLQWKRINHKQSAGWEHLSRLKACAFLLEIFFVRCQEMQELILEIGNAI